VFITSLCWSQIYLPIYTKHLDWFSLSVGNARLQFVKSLPLNFLAGKLLIIFKDFTIVLNNGEILSFRTFTVFFGDNNDVIET
jgi:hypothetical protein